MDYPAQQPGTADGITLIEKAREPLEIVAHVARRTFTALDRKTERPPSRATVDTIQYISEHFSDPLTLNHLARAVQLSKYHLIRKFRKEIGITPGAFLKRYRIVQAMDQLIHTRDTVRKIGRRVGYRDPAAFSRAFAQIAGSQPYLYRVTRSLKVAEGGTPYG